MLNFTLTISGLNILLQLGNRFLGYLFNFDVILGDQFFSGFFGGSELGNQYLRILGELISDVLQQTNNTIFCI